VLICEDTEEHCSCNMYFPNFEDLELPRLLSAGAEYKVDSDWTIHIFCYYLIIWETKPSNFSDMITLVFIYVLSSAPDLSFNT
jgi:hypothetical protein